MAAPRPRIILQSDWQFALSQNKGQAWITYKPTNEASVHGQLQVGGGQPYISGSPGFSVEQSSKYTLTACYNTASHSLRRKFSAQTDDFSNIHPKNHSITALDVTAGGLGVSCDLHHQLLIWQTSDGEVRRRLEGHIGDVYTCKFFPSGLVVLSAGSDMQIKIWSAETGKCATTLHGHKAGILDSAMVDRGRNIVTCGRDGTARLWDVGKSAIIATIDDLGGIVNCCRLGVTENSINLGAPEDNSSDREVHTEGKLLLLGCENSTLQGYGLQSRCKVFEVDCHAPVNACCFLSDVQVALGTQDGHLAVVDIRNTRVPVREWKEARAAILSLQAYKQGFFATTGDGSCFYVGDKLDTTVDLTGSDCDPVYGSATDGSHLFTACRDGVIRKYSLAHI